MLYKDATFYMGAYYMILIIVRFNMAQFLCMWTKFCGLTRFAPIIAARPLLLHEMGRHVVPSVRAPGEEPRRKLRIPLHILNVLLCLDTAISTQNFLYLGWDDSLPDGESLEL